MMAKPKRVLNYREQSIVLEGLAEGWSLGYSLRRIKLNERTSSRIYREDPVISSVLVKNRHKRFDTPRISELAKKVLAERQERILDQD